VSLCIKQDGDIKEEYTTISSRKTDLQKSGYYSSAEHEKTADDTKIPFFTIIPWITGGAIFQEHKYVAILKKTDTDI
jgi:hypothetical protein